MGKKILSPRFPTTKSHTSSSQRMVWRMTCRAERRSILLYLYLLVAVWPCPCVPLSVQAQNNYKTQQGHEACQRLCLTWPAWTVLHLCFTVLGVGMVTPLGSTWLTWLAPNPLPAVTVSRCAPPYPNTCTACRSRVLRWMFLERSWWEKQFR